MTKIEYTVVWLKNARNFHHRLMAYYLRKRGWVVFYLNEEARICNDVCWLDLYQQELKRKG